MEVVHIMTIKRTQSQLKYNWICVQESPVLSSICPLSLTPSSSSDWLNINSLNASVGSIAMITLVVSDSSRESRSSVETYHS